MNHPQNPDSAGNFLAAVSEQIRNWLRDNARNKADINMQWILIASTSDRTMMVVDRLSAQGSSLIKLEGESEDRQPILLLSHYSSIQLRATYIRRDGREPKKRKIGFSTGISGHPDFEVSEE